MVRGLHGIFDSLEQIDDVPVVAPLDTSGAVGVSGRSALPAIWRGPMSCSWLGSIPRPKWSCVPFRVRAAAEWEWLKWLPHCWSSQSPLESDPLASGRAAYVSLLGELETLIARRREEREGDARALPRIVLVLDQPPESERSRLVDVAEHGIGQRRLGHLGGPGAVGPACGLQDGGRGPRAKRGDGHTGRFLAAGGTLVRRFALSGGGRASLPPAFARGRCRHPGVHRERRAPVGVAPRPCGQRIGGPPRVRPRAMGGEPVHSLGPGWTRRPFEAARPTCGPCWVRVPPGPRARPQDARTPCPGGRDHRCR